MTDADLTDRPTIVTGAARGIGRAIAIRFGELGAPIAVFDTDAAGSEETVRQIEAHGGRALAVSVDLAGTEHGMADAVAEVVDAFGSVRILVNNAAVMGSALSGDDADFASTTRDVWMETLAVNLVAPALLAKYVVPPMLEGEGGGCILNIGSAGAAFGDARNVAYRSSKAALVTLTRSMAVSHGPAGIRTNAISPGVTLSEGTLGQASPAALEMFGRVRVVPEAGTPADVAELAVFLVSDPARYINGQTYFIDGGMSIVPPWFAANRPD